MFLISFQKYTSFFSHWGTDQPDDSIAPPACAFFNKNGRLISSKCGGVSKKFICERFLGAPPRCKTGWKPYGDFCYKVSIITDFWR